MPSPNLRAGGAARNRWSAERIVYERAGNDCSGVEVAMVQRRSCSRGGVCCFAAGLLALAGCRNARGDGARQGGGPRLEPPGVLPSGIVIPQTGSSHTVTPRTVEATDARIALLKMPRGFRLAVFARGLGSTRFMAVAEDGTVYVSRDRQGDVLALEDRDGDGRAERVRRVASGLSRVNGVLLSEGKLYMATPRGVHVADRRPDGSLGPARVLIDGLPPGGMHPNRTLGFGPDGMLYVSIGSSCNACVEDHPLHATIARVRPEGSRLEIFARGLRNTLGFDWHPETGRLWGMDNGVDERGDELPPEELNLIEAGADYGWPYCFGERMLDPMMDARERAERERACLRARPMIKGYTAHAAPMAFLFYRGTQFPSEYRHDAFVAMHGSWNRRPPSGHEVVRVRFRGGQPEGFEPFLTGFLLENGEARFGRPVGLALTPRGELLVSDDANGMIYRVWWSG